MFVVLFWSVFVGFCLIFFFFVLFFVFLFCWGFFVVFFLPAGINHLNLQTVLFECEN